MISIHAPRAGRDQEGKQAYGSNEQFQSTRPVRGATGAVGGHGVVQMISIHAPRAGRDEGGYRGLAIYFTFQSTRPVRGATSEPVRIEKTE